MRLPAALLSRLIRSMILLTVLVTSATILAADTVPLTPATPIVIRQVRVMRSEALAEPPADAPGWQTANLPHRVPNPAGATLPVYWYAATFSIPAPRSDLWLFFPMLRTGGKIYLNGEQIDEIRGADTAHQVRWFQPFMLFVPPALLHAGVNRLGVRLATREPLTSFGEFWIGPEPALRPAFETDLFWESTTVTITSIISLLTSGLMLVFWLRRRQETAYALFGISALLWGMRSVIIPMTEIPMSSWLFWRFLYYVATGGFVAWLTIFLLAYCGAPMPRLRRFLLANWLIGSTAFLLVGEPLRLVMDRYWVVSFVPFMAYAVMVLAGFAARKRTLENYALVAAMLLTLGLGIHDYLSHQGFLGVQEFYLLHLGIPAFLLVMAVILLDRFVDSLTQAESSNERLAQRVAERETALALNYEQLRALERDHAAGEERQRIMQDMHDGVGSQLLSTLVMMQRGPVSQPRIVGLLQECLDDMRLALDSLAPHDPDMLAALGNFRFRMAARFSQMGIGFQWHNIDMPEQCMVAPHASLQVLRILQETLTNVLKHAHASEVVVTVRFAPTLLTIQVCDDGVGPGAGVAMSMATTGPGASGASGASGITGGAGSMLSGRGIANMVLRAGRIGGRLRMLEVATGYAIELAVPLAAGQGGAHGH
jgi:signal transduction histidine kinase